MTIQQEISAQELGERLRLARERAKKTQANAANAIDVARTTLVAIEKGARRIRIDELQKIANFYSVSVNSLLRREAVHLDLIPRFRRLAETESQYIEKAVGTLNDLVSAEVELENILGVSHETHYPPEKFIQQGDVEQQAEKHAEELRQYLGIGNGPIADIFSLVQMGLGIRLYQKRLPSKVSGLFVFDIKVGASILLNANHPWERRVQSLAHELGHFVGTRRSPEVLEEGERFLSREERYANAFARAFLTPRKDVESKFKEVTAGATHLTRRHIILLAHFFGISREATVLRLEELGHAKKGTWGWFVQNGGITNEQAEKVIGTIPERRDMGKEQADQPLSLRIGLMAYEAWKRDLMSEGQLASLLKLGRLELRNFLDNLNSDESEEDDILLLPHR